MTVDLTPGAVVAANVSAAPDVSAAISCAQTGIVTVDIAGTFTGLTGQIEASLDGVNWRACDTFMVWEQTQNAASVSFTGIGTARKFIVSTFGAQKIRVNVTAIASGTAVITVVAAEGLASPIYPFKQNINLLTSASRTASNQTGDQSNYYNTGAYVIVDVTVNAGGAGSITVAIEGKDPTSGKYFPILTSTALTAVATTPLLVQPGAVAAANLVSASFMPRTWRVNVTHNNANPITYSIGATTN